MNQTNQGFKTPGQLIQHLLQAHDWSKRALSIVLDMDETAVNRICTDKRPVDAKLALALEDVFGVPADQFLDLQKSFDLAQARIVVQPDPARADRAQLYGNLPLAHMIKRGWLEAKNIRDEKISGELMRFFDVSRLEDIEILPHAAKRTVVSSDPTPAQLAWLYRVKKIAAEMMVAAYSPQSIKAAIERLQGLRISAEGVAKVPRILMEAGIRYVLVESLPSAKIDGVCFWLNDHAPVIGMSLRFDRIDNFWFVLRHELEHVLRLHGRGSNTTMLDANLEGDNAGTGLNIAEEERQANEAAREFCVPKKDLHAFIARKAPLFTEKDLIGFARTIQVHEGIVAGQLQHVTGRYGLFREHLAKVKDIIAPNAVKDGWGDVYPIEP